MNGPTPGPNEVKPSGGVMRRLSTGGERSAVMRLLPVGVPKPVQRSKPATALYLVGLELLVLLPVVMS